MCARPCVGAPAGWRGRRGQRGLARDGKKGVRLPGCVVQELAIRQVDRRRVEWAHGGG